MTKGIKIQTAIKNGKPISIYDSEDRSYFENCYCPDENCRSPLIARKGRIRTHHFAHKTDSSSCYGLETALHLKAKEVIQKLDYFEVPGYRLSLDIYYFFLKDEISKIEKRYDFNIYENLLSKNIFEFMPLSKYFNKLNGRLSWEDLPVFESKKIKLNNYNIISEKKEGSLIPDITLINKQSAEKIHIEVGVTHLINENKRRIIEENDLTVLEIDLSEYYKKHSSPEKDIANYLEKNQFTFMIAKRWINIEKIGRFINLKKIDLIQEFTLVLKALKKIYDEEIHCEIIEEFKQKGESHYIDQKKFLKDHKYKLGRTEIPELLECPNIFKFFIFQAHKTYIKTIL